MAAGIVQLGCGHAHPVPPVFPPDVLSPDCLEWARAQEPLAELGLQAMQAFGRLDPGLYNRDDSGRFGLNPEGVRIEGAVPQPFQNALARVNGDDAARAAFARGLEEATTVCAQGVCPATNYSISVTGINTLHQGDQLFAWEVAGPDFPTVEQWRGFNSLYASKPPLCPVLASLVIRTRASGVAQTARMARTEGEDADAVAAGHPCPCEYAGQVGKTRKADRSCTSCPGYYSFQCTIAH